MRRRILGESAIEVSELGFGSLFASSFGLGLEDSRTGCMYIGPLISALTTAPGCADNAAILGSILTDIHVPLVLSSKSTK